MMTCALDGCGNELPNSWPTRKFCSASCRSKAHRARTSRPCTICGRPVRARGWCGAHYERWRKYGDPQGKPEPKPTTCSVCDSPNYLKGLCNAHYQRMRTYGDPLYHPPRQTPEERFRSNIAVGPIPAHRPELGNCHVWTGPVNGNGYGVLNLQSAPRRQKGVLAHRYAWQLETGRPAEHFVCHHCDNPPCVRLSHLFDGTTGDNTRDMTLKGRHGMQALSEADALAVRREYADGGTRAHLTVKYGISYVTLQRLLTGVTYQHVGGPLHVARHYYREDTHDGHD